MNRGAKVTLTLPVIKDESQCHVCALRDLENASPEVLLSLLSCSRHRGTSPAFFTHDTTVSQAASRQRHKEEKSSAATSHINQSSESKRKLL